MINWDTAVLGPCEAQFGEAAPATYSPKSGATPFDLPGIYDSGHKEIALLDAQSPASTTAPVYGVRAVNFPSPPAPGDRIYVPVAGVTFVVRDVQPDNHGWIKLVLNKSARP